MLEWLTAVWGAVMTALVVGLVYLVLVLGIAP